MAMQAPTACPICGTPIFQGWAPTQSYKEPLSAGKAVIGGILAGPVGAIAGAAMGKNLTIWSCSRCGYSNTYKG